MKAIIFGVGGQDGFYLTKLLKENSIAVVGVGRSAGDVRGDIADLIFVDQLIKIHEPDYIFHLAASSSTRHETLFDNHLAISTGALNVLEAVRLHCPKAKVFLSGSAVQFKNRGTPIDENSAFEATSPYSIARIHSVYAGRYYRESFGLSVYCGYLFNHDSPRRTERHVNQKIVSAVKRIANGSIEKLELGDVNVKKEFNYAGDIVDAMWIFVNQDRVFEAVFGSGKAHSIKEWTEYCFSKIGRNWQEYVVIKEGYKPEYEVLVSNPSILKSLGWGPKVDFQQLADLMLLEA